MVRFSSLSDATSAEMVHPEEVGIVSVMGETMRDAATTSLKRWLPWLGSNAMVARTERDPITGHAAPPSRNTVLEGWDLSLGV